MAGTGEIMKNVADITLSRQELEHVKHVLRVYGLTGQYIGVQRLFTRRQGMLLAKIEDALSRTAPHKPMSAAKQAIAERKRRAQATRTLDYDYELREQASL